MTIRSIWRAVSLASFAMLAAPALAAAGSWTAAMEEDEGGPVMVASVSAESSGDVAPMLRLMCAGDAGVMMRYEAASGGEEPASESDFTFKNENTEVTRHMLYEEMDGAYAAYFPKTDALVALLKTGQEVFVSEAGSKAAAQAFGLKGSSKAIDRVLKGCQ